MILAVVAFRKADGDAGVLEVELPDAVPESDIPRRAERVALEEMRGGTDETYVEYLSYTRTYGDKSERRAELNEQAAVFTLRDDAGVGAEVTATVAPMSYGLEVTLRRGDEEATVLIDYFDGRLVLRTTAESAGQTAHLAHLRVGFYTPQTGRE